MTTDKATGATEILAGATNAQITLGTANTNVTISGASFGLLFRKVAGAPATYALLSSGGTITFTGLPSDISFNVTNFSVEINNTGLDVTTLISTPLTIHTPGGDVPLSFAGLGSGNVESVQGTVALTLANSGVAAGGLAFTSSFAFANSTDPAHANVDRIYIGLSNVSAFLGTPDGTSFGLQISNGQLGLVIYRDSTAQTTTYALSASGTISLVGIPTDLGLTVSAAIQINTTGNQIAETISTPAGMVNVDLAASSSLRVFSGTATFDIGSFATLSGGFSFTEVNTGAQTKLLIGAANVTGSANDGTNLASLSNASLGLVIFWNNVTGQSPGYALTATGTVSVLSGTGTATATITRNTTLSSVAESVMVGTTAISITFDATQTADTGTGAPCQHIAISNIGVNTPFPALNGLLASLTITAGSDGVTGTVAPTTFDHLVLRRLPGVGQCSRERNIDSLLGRLYRQPLHHRRLRHAVPEQEFLRHGRRQGRQHDHFCQRRHVQRHSASGTQALTG